MSRPFLLVKALSGVVPDGQNTVKTSQENAPVCTFGSTFKIGS